LSLSCFEFMCVTFLFFVGLFRPSSMLSAAALKVFMRQQHGKFLTKQNEIKLRITILQAARRGVPLMLSYLLCLLGGGQKSKDTIWGTNEKINGRPIFLNRDNFYPRAKLYGFTFYFVVLLVLVVVLLVVRIDVSQIKAF
jgi:hypothetical protein